MVLVFIFLWGVLLFKFKSAFCQVDGLLSQCQVTLKTSVLCLLCGFISVIWFDPRYSFWTVFFVIVFPWLTISGCKNICSVWSLVKDWCDASCTKKQPCSVDLVLSVHILLDFYIYIFFISSFSFPFLIPKWSFMNSNSWSAGIIFEFL